MSGPRVIVVAKRTSYQRFVEEEGDPRASLLVKKKDPAVRYQDAYEFAVDLRTCLAELRSRETAAKKEQNGSGTRTLKLDSTADRAPLAPAARSIAAIVQRSLWRYAKRSRAPCCCA